MCTDVFLFFRGEEICHVVNVVCISLHVRVREREREMQSDTAFFLRKKLLVFFILTLL